MIPNLKVEVLVLAPVLCKGMPRQDTLQALDKRVDSIARRHQEQGFA